MKCAGYRWNLGLPCGVFLLLATLNAAVIPFFEFPDERHHVHYCQFLAREGEVPTMNYACVTDTRTTVRAAFHPPLYYLLASLAMDPSIEDVSPALQWNPRGARAFSEGPSGGWGRFGSLPWRLSALRVLSIFIGIGTVVGCFAFGRTVHPSEPAVAIGMAWVPVCLPQFVSMSAAINNEGLAIALATVATWLAARAAVRRSAGGSFAAGAVFGLSLFAKVSGLAILPAFGLLLASARDGRWRRLIEASLAILLVAGPWFVYNAVAYGDPFGLGSLASSEPPHAAPTPSIASLARGMTVLFCSFYACYGQLAVWLPAVHYLLPTSLALLAAIGFARRAHRLESSLPALPAVALLGIAGLVGSALSYAVRVRAPQGRYLFIGIAYLALAAIAGLLTWCPVPRRTRVVVLAGAAMALLQLGYLVLCVWPAYHR